MIYKIKTDLVPFPDLAIEHLRNKKFYESRDILTLFPQNPYWFKIIDGGKNKGKTHELLEQIKECIKNKIKFCLGRFSWDNWRELLKEIDIDKFKKEKLLGKYEWPIYAEKGELYDCETGEHVGKSFYLDKKGLNKFTSIQFHHYGKIFVDEYSPTYDGRQTTRELEDQLYIVDNFIKFCNDVQRAKPDLEVWLYGNNNNEFNIFKQYFGVDFRHKILLDKDAGLCIINFKDLYIGVTKDTKAAKLLKYSDKLKAFFTKNESGKLSEDILPLTLFNGLRLNYQIVYNNYVYHIMYGEGEYFAIKKDESLFLNVPHYALTLRDVTADPNTIMLPKKDTKLITLVRKLIENKLVYDSPETKNLMALLLNETYRYYEQEYLLFWEKG